MNQNILVRSSITIWLCCILLLCFFTLSSHSTLIAEQNPSDEISILNNVTAEVNGETSNISLPYTWKGLDDDTLVTISAYFTLPDGEYMYLHTDHAAYSLYIEESLIYEYGQDGTYPNFLGDSVESGQIIQITDDASSIHMRLEFYTPSTQNTFTISPIYLGSYPSIFESLFNEVGFSAIFSLFLIIVGILLCIITIFIVTFDKNGIAFLWLGLSSFAVGTWLLGSCPLTTLFFNNPVDLYLRSLCGMILFPIPLIYYGITVINFHSNRPLLLFSLCEWLLGFIGLLMCFFNILPLEHLEEIYFVTVPLCMCLFALMILREYVVYKNESAQRFSIPVVSLALFTALDFIDYRLNIANLPVTFFQIGVMVFLLSMGIVAGIFINDALHLAVEKQSLTFKMNLMDYQIKGQKQQTQLILSNAEELKKQRHDLRHQLAVIRELSECEDKTQLKDYLDALVDNIPNNHFIYCQNMTVNFILSHYASICQQEGIPLSINLDIPLKSDHIPDTDYCVIFGNLLENAIEACKHIPENSRFIHLNSRMQYNILIITMDNSFDGNFRTNQGRFYSRKRDDYGIGLSSIQSVATKHGGDAQFKTKKDVFSSSLYFAI